VSYSDSLVVLGRGSDAPPDNSRFGRFNSRLAA
jgi:hypothetical protein